MRSRSPKRPPAEGVPPIGALPDFEKMAGSGTTGVLGSAGGQVFFLSLGATLAGAEPYAILVGADIPPPGRTKLKYASSDAAAVRDVLADVGGYGPGSLVLLVDPQPAQVLAALAAVPADAEPLLFYFSGHADATTFYTGGKALPVAAVKAAMDRLPARVRLGVVDACRGGGWTGAKGFRVGYEAEAPHELARAISRGGVPEEKPGA